jgi:alpha-glucuronidase
MASIFKSDVAAAIGITPVTLKTSTKQTTIIGLSVCNVSGASVNVDVKVWKGGSTQIFVVKSVPVPVGGTLVVIGGDQKVVLENTDLLKVNSDTAASLDVVCSYLEID